MEKKKIKVKEGYFFSNEHGNEVTVLAVRGNYCMVSDDSKKKPFVLPIEYIEAIQEATEEAKKL